MTQFHEDNFCPECGRNVGPGTLESLGCPLCGYSGDVDDEEIRRSCILRISRHEATDSHIRALEKVFGDDFEIITENLEYGDDPLRTVANFIQNFEHSDEGEIGNEIIAVEAAGPESVLLALVEGLGVPVVRPVFRRENGRVAVVGKDANDRDIFEVERYERLEIEMRPALAGKPL